MGISISKHKVDWSYLPKELKSIVLQYTIDINNTIIDVISTAKLFDCIIWLSEYTKYMTYQERLICTGNMLFPVWYTVSNILYIVAIFGFNISQLPYQQLLVQACNYNQTDKVKWLLGKCDRLNIYAVLPYAIQYCSIDTVVALVTRCPQYLDHTIYCAITNDKLDIVKALSIYETMLPDTRQSISVYFADRRLGVRKYHR